LPSFDLFQQIHPDPQTMSSFQPEQFVQPARAQVPALVAATWSDQGLHTRGSFEGFKQTSASEKWLYTHGRPKWSTFYGDGAVEFQRAFFDHFLKGRENGMDARPPVRLEVRETLEQYEVRFEDEWPLARTGYRELYLDGASGELSDTQPEDASVVEYDPLADSATCTITFDDDTELTGNMKLRLWVSTTGATDMDLFVGIRKLDVDGDEVHFYAKTGYTKGPVAMGWLRVSERALDEERSTPWQPVLSHDAPQPLTPGEIVPVDIEIVPSSTPSAPGSPCNSSCREPTSSSIRRSPMRTPVTSTRECTPSTRVESTTHTCSCRRSRREPRSAEPSARTLFGPASDTVNA
jgi:putative CocE/NonD family hydrolase